MTFKDKFLRDPQLDAEGFTMMDAKCCGCAPTDMCPRSGHCERYMSPLRATHGIPAWMVDHVTSQQAAYGRAAAAFAEHTAEMAEAKALVEQADRAMSETDVLYHELTGRLPKRQQGAGGAELPHVTLGRAE